MLNTSSSAWLFGSLPHELFIENLKAVVRKFVITNGEELCASGFRAALAELG
jgi:hypothetical protein